MKALGIIFQYGSGLGLLLMVVGFVLMPFFIGIPLLVFGILVSVISFYRKWFILIVPEEVRHKIGSEIAKSYEPYQPALHSTKELMGDIIKIAAGVFCVLLVSTAIIIFYVTSRGGNYWECNEQGVWSKHGWPDYPAPIITCPYYNPLPQEREACLAQGGVWAKQGPEPFETCNRRADDVGNTCRDNGECKGWCQVGLSKEEIRQGIGGDVKTQQTYGQCSGWVVELGCFGMMDKGRVQVICID